MFALALVLVCAVGVADAAEKPRAAFTKAWEGRRVVLKRTLFTLVYDELGRVGVTHKGKRAGLNVATPSADAYFQFDGRQSEDDIKDRDPNRLFESVNTRYHRAMHLDVGTVQHLKPVMLMRFEPGVEMFVRTVHVERDRIRLVLHKLDPDQNDEVATTLTVKWPVPLSKDLTERALIDAVIYQFVGPQP